jgi:hypothetical protein
MWNLLDGQMWFVVIVAVCVIGAVGTTVTRLDSGQSATASPSGEPVSNGGTEATEAATDEVEEEPVPPPVKPEAVVYRRGETLLETLSLLNTNGELHGVFKKIDLEARKTVDVEVSGSVEGDQIQLQIGERGYEGTLPGSIDRRGRFGGFAFEMRSTDVTPSEVITFMRDEELTKKLRAEVNKRFK